MTSCIEWNRIDELHSMHDAISMNYTQCSGIYELDSMHVYGVKSHVWMMWMSHVVNRGMCEVPTLAIWVCHSYEWIMWLIWMNHVTPMHESIHVVSHVWRMWMSHVTNQKVRSPDVGYMCLSPIWMSHVTHMNESCDSYEWIMSLLWMSLYMSCHTYESGEWVMSLIGMCWVPMCTYECESCHTSQYESCHTSECVRKGHVTYMNESCRQWQMCGEVPTWARVVSFEWHIW